MARTQGESSKHTEGYSESSLGSLHVIVACGTEIEGGLAVGGWVLMRLDTQTNARTQFLEQARAATGTGSTR